jgi:PHD/YefM family antitoxin component YafN of YafNO toxin-antitoxin module
MDRAEQRAIHFLKNDLDIYIFPYIIVIYGGEPMFVNTENMISVTELQKVLLKKLKEVSETNEPLYILRNNQVAAVVLSSEEYRMLQEAEEILEHFEIADMAEKRLKHYDPSKNVSWKKIKKEHGL